MSMRCYVLVAGVCKGELNIYEYQSVRRVDVMFGLEDVYAGINFEYDMFNFGRKVCKLREC